MKPQKAKVAYTIDGYQPVKSTIISPDPLFYASDEPLACNLPVIKKNKGPRPELTLPAPMDQVLIYSTMSKMASLGYGRYKLRLNDSVPKAEIRWVGLDLRVLVNRHLSSELAFIYACSAIREHSRPSLKWKEYDPDSAATLRRLLEADRVAFITKCCWEAKLLGFTAPWEYLRSSCYEGICRPFEAEAFDFRNLKNGQAMVAAFEAWFLYGFCKTVNKATIKDMLASSDYYDQTHNCKKLSAPCVAAIGELEDSKNYLAPYALIILTEDIFTHMRSRSEANFLWFIKFERFFRETKEAPDSTIT